MVRGFLQTFNYQFEVFGNDEDHARQLMEAAWKDHAAMFEKDGFSIDPFDHWEDAVWYCEVEIGRAYRDNEIMKGVGE